MNLFSVLIIGILISIWVQSLLFGLIARFLIKRNTTDPVVWPFLNIIVPSFNEGEGVYGTLKSLSTVDYPADRFNVTVVDDCSKDDTPDWVRRAISEFTNIDIRLIAKPVNQGKQRALLDGFHATTGDIFVAFDSDVRAGKTILKSFARELQDEDLGVVGATCGVHDPNRSLISQGFAAVYYATFHFIKQVESLRGTVSVIGGMCIGVRRKVYEEVEKRIENNMFMGLKMMAGEDRHLTHQLMLQGYKTKVVIDRVTTSAPATLNELYRQQLRWRRSGMRDFFQTLGALRQHIHRLGIFRTTTILLSRFTYILIPFVYLSIILSGSLISVLAAQTVFFLFIFMLRFALNVHARVYHPDQVLHNPFWATLALSSWMAIDLVLTTPMALMTLDEGGWGTRNLPTTSEKIT